jgi:hypothetical protein
MMHKAWVAAIAASSGFGWAGPVAAQQAIPIIIHWDKTAPTQVILQDGDDSSDLPSPNASKIIKSTVTRPPAEQLFKRIKLIVSYGDVDIPLIVNVRPASAKIEMWLTFEAPKSCFDRYLYAAEISTDNSVDAMRRMLIAAYVLRIGAPDDCRSVGYEPRALRARLERNQNLATSSGGLFGINEDWRRDVAALPVETFRIAPASIAASASAEATGALVSVLYNVDMKKADSAADSLVIAKGLEALSARDDDAKTALKTTPLAADIAVYEQRAASSR